MLLGHCRETASSFGMLQSRKHVISCCGGKMGDIEILLCLSSRVLFKGFFRMLLAACHDWLTDCTLHVCHLHMVM